MCFSVYIGYGLLNVNQAFQTRLPGPGDHLILVLIQISINFSHFNFLTTQQSFSTRIDLTLHVAVIQSPALHLEGFFPGKSNSRCSHTNAHCPRRCSFACPFVRKAFKTETLQEEKPVGYGKLTVRSNLSCQGLQGSPRPTHLHPPLLCNSKST